MKKILKKQRGFTLVELMIVIAIIVVLSVILIPTGLNYPSQARDKQRQQDVKKITDLLQVHALDQASWVNDGGDATTFGWHCLDVSLGTNNDFYRFFIQENLPQFAGNYPQDPEPSDQNLQLCSGQYAILSLFWFVDFFPEMGHVIAVFSSVENEENGNFDITQPDLMQVLTGSAPLHDSGQYYVNLVYQ